MAQRFLTAVVLAVGCYNPTTQSCDIACATDGTEPACPDGFTCSTTSHLCFSGTDTCGSGSDDGSGSNCPEPPTTDCSMPMTRPGVPGCVLACNGPVSGQTASTFTAGANSWAAYPVGSGGDENIALQFAGQPIWVGVTRPAGSNGQFEDPAPPGSNAPPALQPEPSAGGSAPPPDGHPQCVLVTGSGWVEQDCDSGSGHPFLLFVPPKM